ncbi:propanediol dehydratase, partial [Lactobacillus sp. XV13L]|nr:propanediol dehydratase [Lactobacillus sp. XV13L]
MSNNFDRPSIIIGLNDNQKIQDIMNPLFNGIEEEKIPVITQVISVNNIVQIAYKAAL